MSKLTENNTISSHISETVNSNKKYICGLRRPKGERSCGRRESRKKFEEGIFQICCKLNSQIQEGQ